MKYILILFLVFSTRLQASECAQVLSFERNDYMILNEIIVDSIGYNSMQDFRNDKRILAYQFNAMPNYYRSGAEYNLHYRLIIHYNSFSTTFIYDSVLRKVVKTEMYSGW